MGCQVPGEAAAVVMMLDTTAPARAAFARVEVYWDSAAILDAWADLEAVAPCSIYQTRGWLLPWIETLAAKAGIVPFFVLARGTDERPLSLLCLGMSKRGPLRIATWLGGSDANFNMPMLHPGISWTPPEVLRLLREAAKACGRDRPDLFNLANQPFEWGGRANAFAHLAHQPSPSAAFGTALPGDSEAFFAAKISKDSRKKLRKKEAKLAALGNLTHLVVNDVADQRRVIETFLAQKVERFRAQKIASEFECPEMRAFIETASRPAGSGIELHALALAEPSGRERFVAIYGGAAHDGQWSGMFNSFDGDDEISKSSPGDLLLMRIISKACAEGLTRFDLGIGEARYKAALCDERIPLFDAIVPVSLTGVVVARLIAAKQVAKRRIKASPRLFALAKTIRLRGAR